MESADVQILHTSPTTTRYPSSRPCTIAGKAPAHVGRRSFIGSDTRPGNGVGPDHAVPVMVRDLRDADSPRTNGLDLDHVRLLAESGARLPPIVVHAQTMRVVDGMHRLMAARLKGLDEIDATFFRGDAEEAFRAGVKANITHGLPLSLADRKAAAARIIRTTPSMSDRVIALVTGLAHKTVASIRTRLGGVVETQGRTGRDGRTRPLSAAAGRLEAFEFIARRPDASLREIARTAGISVGTARDVRLRVLAGEDPLPGNEAGHDGAAGRHARSGNSDREAGETDPRAILDVLRRDPSLRYTDSGRTLLRWLDQRVLTVDQWQETVTDVPPHCLELVERIARECARSWTAVADSIAGQ